VDDDELVPIGRFARLSGLSIHTLRHYDEVGLLAPADVDAATGYRRYRRDQMARARRIRQLRWLDLPIDDIRPLVDEPDTEAARRILERHRGRLERQASLIADRLLTVGHLVQEGLPVQDTVTTTIRPVQIKLAVDDANAAHDFYQRAFGLQSTVIRRTEDEEISAFQFGRYDHGDFFLLHLEEDEGNLDRPGRSTIGFLVADLDATHRRAIDAGAVEAVPRNTPVGMPRNAAVKDPSGNWIWLYQA
jgi:DNA-binding transcriptional MerR regulator